MLPGWKQGGTEVWWRCALTGGHSAHHVEGDLTGFTLTGLIDGRHSELVNVAFSQSRDLESGVQMGPVPVDLDPAGTLPLTPLHQVVDQRAATITLWLQPLHSCKVLS